MMSMIDETIEIRPLNVSSDNLLVIGAPGFLDPLENPTACWQPPPKLVSKPENTDAEKNISSIPAIVPEKEIAEEITSLGLDLVRCPSCKFAWENGGKSLTFPQFLVLENGKKITDQTLLDHYAGHRFRCQNCSTVFCSQCSATPYHLGSLCEDNSANDSGSYQAPCRFCGTSVLIQNYQIPQNVCCYGPKCRKYLNRLCTRPLSCGHFCQHDRFHQNSCEEYSCLAENCSRVGETTLEDFCSICWTDELATSPIAQLPCGHSFHFRCLSKRLKNKWGTGAVSLQYMCCPLCNAFIEEKFTKVTKMSIICADAVKIRKDLTLRIGYQLEQENLLVPDQTDVLEFGLRKFNFYRCQPCKWIYFGGKRECGEMFQANSSEQDVYKCDSCRGCSVHGADFLVFKCKFCCSIANWFCFGNTHFCEPCHSNWLNFVDNNEHFYLKEGAKLPKCSGKDSCPLQIDHPPHGEEFLIGCKMCDDSLASAEISKEKPVDL